MRTKWLNFGEGLIQDADGEGPSVAMSDPCADGWLPLKAVDTHRDFSHDPQAVPYTPFWGTLGKVLFGEISMSDRFGGQKWP